MKVLHAALVALLFAGYLAAQAPTKHPHGPGKQHHAPAPSPCKATGPIQKGVERWPIKTSLPGDLDLKQAKSVAFPDLITLADPPGVKKDDAGFQSARIPAFTNSQNLKEGDLVTLTGWLWLVALESDGDYHIQISASSQSGDHCLIVEVPNPDPAFDASPPLRPAFQAIRNFLKTRTLNNQEPSRCGSVMMHPPYLQLTGQLFYDDAHVGDPQPRGKKNMHAATLWELHPVVAMQFAPKPKP